MSNTHITIEGIWMGTTQESSLDTTAPFYVTSNGEIKATDGNIGGISITSSSIQSTNFGASTGFQLNSDGSAVFRNITISGYATSAEVSTAQSTANSANTAALAAQADADQGILDAASAQSTANTANSTANTANSTASSVDGTVTNIKNNLFYGGTTEINGGTIRTGTISADDITTGTLSLGSASFDSGGLTAVGTVTIAPSNSNSSIGNSYNTLAGSSLTVYGGGTIQGTIQADNFKDRTTNTNIDMSSSFIYMKPAGAFELSIGGTTSTFYGSVNPSADNSKDLGSGSRRWRAIYRLNEYSTSDERLKENIVALPYGLDFINNLQPKEFNWKAMDVGYSCDTCKQVYDTLVDCDTEDCEGTVSLLTTELNNDKVFGFLAQDIEDVLPNTTDYQLLKYDSTDDEYTYSQSNLIAPLVKAIQELSTQVSDLTARIETLEG